MKKFTFETGLVTLQHCHTIEPDLKEKFGPNACGEYSLYMLMNESEAQKLEAKIIEVIDKTIPHLKDSSSFHYPGTFDEKTGLYRFRCKHNPKYGRPEVIFKEHGLGVNCEIPSGSTGEVSGVVHPYEDYGGGIKLIFKQVIIHKLVGREQGTREPTQQKAMKPIFLAEATVIPPWEDNEPVKPVAPVTLPSPSRPAVFPPIPPPRQEAFVPPPSPKPIKPLSTPVAANDDNRSDFAARFAAMRMRSIGR